MDSCVLFEGKTCSWAQTCTVSYSQSPTRSYKTHCKGSESVGIENQICLIIEVELAAYNTVLQVIHMSLLRKWNCKIWTHGRAACVALPIVMDDRSMISIFSKIFCGTCDENKRLNKISILSFWLSIFNSTQPQIAVALKLKVLFLCCSLSCTQ